ncbi:MAG: hypothetical protein M3O82_07655, partial [Verrucomicrobiota bacterium]|nr:hypothetical protein [Verrucomicrobiota bacterium]
MKQLGMLLVNLEKLAGRLPDSIAKPVGDHLQRLRKLFVEGELDAARRSDNPAIKKEAAQNIVSTTVALCTTVALEPIPLADFPLLTSLQVMMVAGIIHVSGRKVGAKAAVEFLGALGVNVGAGMIFREGSRALLKFFPIVGNMASGAIAGAGTY